MADRVAGAPRDVRGPGWTTPRGATVPGRWSTSAAARGQSSRRGRLSGSTAALVRALHRLRPHRPLPQPPPGMPRGHSVEDMADDVARFVTDELGGRADLVLGCQLRRDAGPAPRRPPRTPPRPGGRRRRGGPVERRGADGRRAARPRARGRRRPPGPVPPSASTLLPGQPVGAGCAGWPGPFVGRMLTKGKHYPPGDVLVEVEAELGFDARTALPHIERSRRSSCAATRTRSSPPTSSTRREALIPDCTRVRYPGRGHLWVASNRQVPQDVQRRPERRHRRTVWAPDPSVS